MNDLKLGFRLLKIRIRHEKIGAVVLACFALVGLVMDMIGDIFSIAIGPLYYGLVVSLIYNYIFVTMNSGIGASSPLRYRLSTRVASSVISFASVALYALFLLIRVGKIYLQPAAMENVQSDLWYLGMIIGAMYVFVITTYSSIGNKSLVGGTLFLEIGLMICIGGSVGIPFIHQETGPWNISLGLCIIAGVGVIALTIVANTLLIRKMYYKDNSKKLGIILGQTK